MDKRSQIARICGVIAWSPSDEELAAILRDFAQAARSSVVLDIGICQAVIARHCPSARFFLKEGIDNSDLNTLLALATRKE